MPTLIAFSRFRWPSSRRPRPKLTIMSFIIESEQPHPKLSQDCSSDCIEKQLAHNEMSGRSVETLGAISAYNVEIHIRAYHLSIYCAHAQRAGLGRATHVVLSVEIVDVLHHLLSCA